MLRRQLGRPEHRPSATQWGHRYSRASQNLLCRGCPRPDILSTVRKLIHNLWRCAYYSTDVGMASTQTVPTTRYVVLVAFTERCGNLCLADPRCPPHRGHRSIYGSCTLRRRLSRKSPCQNPNAPLRNYLGYKPIQGYMAYRRYTTPRVQHGRSVSDHISSFQHLDFTEPWMQNWVWTSWRLRFRMGR